MNAVNAGCTDTDTDTASASATAVAAAGDSVQLAGCTRLGWNGRGAVAILGVFAAAPEMRVPMRLRMAAPMPYIPVPHALAL